MQMAGVESSGRGWAVALLAMLCVFAPVRGAGAQEVRDTIRFGVVDEGPAPRVIEAPAEAFDTPATRSLVLRVIEASGEIPDELRDYRARVHSAMYLTLASDTAPGGDLPITADEFVSDVRWHRLGHLQQTVEGHRVRLLAPAPYSLGTIMEDPWVVPHLYGSTIRVLTPVIGAPRPGQEVLGLHPFGESGPVHYGYEAGDPITVFVEGERIVLLPLTVRPRIDTGDRRLRLAVGTFWIDTTRAAVARARFGFTEPSRGILRLAETGTFLELENGLWQGRYWLPFRQRRELQMASRLLGGAVTGRIVNVFQEIELNTGWEPPAGRPRDVLVRAERADGRAVFADWQRAVGEDAGAYAADDFEDLRIAATAAQRRPTGPYRAQLHWQRGEHLFRYNRVEGLFLGAGAQVVPADPFRRDWELYGTLGWAFAEGTPRGELQARWRPGAVGGAGMGRGATQWEYGAGVYRRLYDVRAFQPTFEWMWVYGVIAALAGADERDYYDGTGAMLGAARRSGPWTTQLIARYERHDTVRINTTRYLFGQAPEFPPLADLEPGNHAALEGELAYAFGPGALGIGNSIVASARAETGLADFHFTRLVGLASFRRETPWLTLLGRVDAGHVLGDGAPPQRLFRFGVNEGLRGYDANVFGGSTAALARGRLLLPLPPRESQPIARRGPFIVPPLRPALVLLGEAGWTSVSDGLRPQMQRLGVRETDDVLGSFGGGVSIFDDALTVEYLVPLREDDAARRGGRWYIGFARWF
jgi:hypothetical protein